MAAKLMIGLDDQNQQPQNAWFAKCEEHNWCGELFHDEEDATKEVEDHNLENVHTPELVQFT